MKLTIVIDVDKDIDPVVTDPHEVADAVLDSEDPSPSYRYTFVSAGWDEG
jgi:hypothetical protein